MLGSSLVFKWKNTHMYKNTAEHTHLGSQIDFHRRWWSATPKRACFWYQTCRKWWVGEGYLRSPSRLIAPFTIRHPHEPEENGIRIRGGCWAWGFSGDRRSIGRGGQRAAGWAGWVSRYLWCMTQQGHQRGSQCYIINVASRQERLTFSQGFLFVLDELSVKYGRASFQRLLILVSFAM